MLNGREIERVARILELSPPVIRTSNQADTNVIPYALRIGTILLSIVPICHAVPMAQLTNELVLVGLTDTDNV